MTGCFIKSIARPYVHVRCDNGFISGHVREKIKMNFTGQLGLQGLVCPCCRVWSAPAGGGGGRPPGVQVGVLLPPSGSNFPTSFDS
jgi:hypothetical protein